MTRREFLKKQKILRLATADGSARPHVVAVWYLFSGKKFLIGTNTRTKKVKNIQENPKIAFCVDEGIHSPNIYGVMGTGDAQLILDNAKVRNIAKKILLKYFKTLEKRSAKELLDDTNCIIQITPKKMTVWNY